MWQRSGAVLFALFVTISPALAVRGHSFPEPVTLAQDADATTDSSTDAGSDELDGAGKALTYLQSATNLAALANGLSSRTAAQSGIDFSLAITTLFAYAQSQPQGTYVEKDPGLAIDLGNYLAQYQITAQTGLTQDSVAVVEPHGREFLAGLQPLIDRWNALLPPGGLSADEMGNADTPLYPVDVAAFIDLIPAGIGDCYATVVSPTRVRLAPKDTSKRGEPTTLYAVLETDGVWRIEVPNVAAVWHAKFLAGAATPPPPPAPHETIPPAKHAGIPPADPAAAPLFEAINNLQYAEVKRIATKHPEWLNARNRFGETPLMKAVSDGDELIVACLLSQNIDLTAVDKHGLTAFGRATKLRIYGPMPKSYGTRNGIPPSLVNIAKLLLEHGAP